MSNRGAGEGTRPTIAGPDDVRRAIESLSEADFVKLERYAGARVSALGAHAGAYTGSDLLQEAFLALLEERRHGRPDRVDFMGQLLGSMKSIANAWKRKGEGGRIEKAERHFRRTGEEGEELETPISLASDSQPNAEEQLLLRVSITQEEFLAELAEMFSDDLLAEPVLEGWREGMSGPELISKIDELTEKTFASTVRRIRRRITKRWPGGIPNVR